MLQFASLYNDLSFNTSKSWILRLGTNKYPPVSVCGIPVTECHEYLGVFFGRPTNPQQDFASKLYQKANIMFAQNQELHKCSRDVKNMAINAYGNVYALETLLEVNSTLRQAHRYLTRAVHTDWRIYADLPGPNIRSRRLYTVYGVDSLEVQHRRSRNQFLIRAESFSDNVICGVLGFLPRITA